MMQFKSTEELPVPEKLIDQVIGQDAAVKIIKKAAAQRRNVLLIGPPGTGKSMLAQAMAEIMPAETLEDVLVYPNPNDENRPLVRVVKTNPSQEEIRQDPFLQEIYNHKTQSIYEQMGPDNNFLPAKPKRNRLGFYTQPKEKGYGRRIVEYSKRKHQLESSGVSPTILLVGLLLLSIVFIYATDGFSEKNRWFSLALLIGVAILFFIWRFTSQIGRRMGFSDGLSEPKLIVDNSGMKTAPFVDATGSKAGALFGDVKHDPLQSGGLGTPAHLRVEAGAIHKANKGVLFIDEIASMSMKSQQDILTAMQEKQFPITGQSEQSSGAIVKTEPVPCDFVLVAAGNIHDLAGMHPALRSRIRGNGYEIYVEESIPDCEETENKFARFVAQEVKKDGKIPHFTRDAVEEIIAEARKRSFRKKHLSLNLRELGGLIRAAGDIAREEGASLVDATHIRKARAVAQTLEQQISTRSIEYKKDYRIFVSHGEKIGKVNGLAVMGEGASGIVLPIVAEVTPASSKNEGKIIATGKLGEIAKEAISNVSAIIKKHIGKNVYNYDIHVQFLQTYEGVEGDSASISVAVAVISALESIGVKQNFAMTGSLSVRGEVLPVGGVNAKCEAAFESGIEHVIVPTANSEGIFLSETAKKSLKIHPVSRIDEVLSLVLQEGKRKSILIKRLQKNLRE
ncbi:MAG: ATP-dependent protease LonB [Candidatus Anstonellales archaeon]